MQPASLAQWQAGLSSRTSGENRPDLAQELMTRFPIGKGARMIRAVMAKSLAASASRASCSVANLPKWLRRKRGANASDIALNSGQYPHLLEWASFLLHSVPTV
jgi:hypothetical protein